MHKQIRAVEGKVEDTIKKRRRRKTTYTRDQEATSVNNSKTKSECATLFNLPLAIQLLLIPLPLPSSLASPTCSPREQASHAAKQAVNRNLFAFTCKRTDEAGQGGQYRDSERGRDLADEKKKKAEKKKNSLTLNKAFSNVITRINQ